MDIPDKQNNRRSMIIGSTLIVLAAMGFSSKSILIKLAYSDSAAVDAITLMTLRMLFALPFFLVAAMWRPSARPTPLTASDRLGIVVLGILGYYLASFLDFSGLELISAGLERLILFLYPTLVVVLTAVLYRRRIAVAQLAALALSYAGIAFVFASDAVITQSSNLQLGSLLVFGSAVVFAVFMTGSGHLIPRLGSRRFTALSMSIACLATLLHFSLSKPLTQLQVSGSILFLGVMLALVSTVIPAFLMNAGIQRIGAARTSIISAAGPVATLLMAWAVLGETLSLGQLAGAAMVLSGVLLVSLTKEKSA